MNLMNSSRERPKTTTGSTTDDEEGSTHLIECMGKGQTGIGCISWVHIWPPRKLSKVFITRSFLCGFRAADEVAELQSKFSKIVNSFRSVENCQFYIKHRRVFGVLEDQNEDVYQTVINVAKNRKTTVQSGHQHLLQSDQQKCEDWPNASKFYTVCAEANKIGLMTRKSKLKQG